MSQPDWPEFFRLVTADECARHYRDTLIFQYDNAISHLAAFPETSKMRPPISETQRQALPAINTMQELVDLRCPHDFICEVTNKTWPEIKQLLEISGDGDYPLRVCFQVVEHLYEVMRVNENNRTDRA